MSPDLGEYTCGFCPGTWWVDQSDSSEREPMWCTWCGHAGILKTPRPDDYEALHREYLIRMARWSATHPDAPPGEREAACAWICAEMGL